MGCRLTQGLGDRQEEWFGAHQLRGEPHIRMGGPPPSFEARGERNAIGIHGATALNCEEREVVMTPAFDPSWRSHFEEAREPDGCRCDCWGCTKLRAEFAGAAAGRADERK